MNYKLIMLPNPILVSDEEIKEGDWYFDDTHTIRKSFTDDEYYWSKRPEYKKIIAGIEGLPKLDLSAIVERIGWVDVEKLAENFIKEEWVTSDEPVKFGIEVGYEEGFKAAKSLNEKKYSLEDIDKAIEYALDNPCPFQKDLYQDLVKSLSKPKEYNVEVEMEEYDHKEEWSEIGGAFETFKTRIKVTKIL